jgi:hypothetical protein
MMKSLLPLASCIGALILITSLVSGQTQQCMSGCSAVLQGGVFNEDKINSSQMSKEAFRDWLCVAEFKNHNEAHDAGINIGVLVYDVPLTIGGTWKDGQQETWKKNSCSDQQRSAEKVSTYARALRTASPDILAAWSKCVETACGAAGHPRLACEVSSISGATLFKSNWLREVGEATASAPKVKFYKAYDAKCDRAWAVGQRLTEAVSTFRCTPTTDRDAVFILETDGGSCTPAGSVLKAKESLSGRISLVAERHIKADVITIASDALIITNGFKLTLEATEVHLDGSPKIMSFESRDGRPAGENGRNAGPIIIKAAKVTGTSVVITNSGENGVKGAAGAKGGPGAPGHQGTQRDWDFGGCHGGSNGTPGGPGGTGGDGGPGGRGGNGGAVIYAVASGIASGPIKRIDVVTTRTGQDGAPVSCGGTCGGLGAAGGDSGPGGDGGPGGQGAAGGHGGCGGTDAGPAGGTGAIGRHGTDGGDGSAGQIVPM